MSRMPFTPLKASKYSEVSRLLQNLDNLNVHDMTLIKRLCNKGYDEIIVHHENSEEFNRGWNDGWNEGFKEGLEEGN